MIRFEMCRIPGCAAWPVHGKIVAETHERMGATSPLFSKERAQLTLQFMAERGLIDSDRAGEIDADIMKSPLPYHATPEDRLVQHHPSWFAQEHLNRRFGIIPAEKGSGDTRIETCTGLCEYANCKSYPAHAVFFFKGFAKPIFQMFSHEAALANLENCVNRGLITDDEREMAVEALGSIRLAKKLTRACRVMRSGHVYTEEHLDYILGVKKLPDGVEEAAFTICEASIPKAPHGHFSVYGLKLSSGFASNPTATKGLMDLIDSGFIDPVLTEKVTREIEAAKLPERSAVEDATSAAQELAKALDRLV